jgi:hypothetical protein
MSELAIIKVFKDDDIKALLTDVVNKCIFAEIVKHGYSVFGENSGHPTSQISEILEMLFLLKCHYQKSVQRKTNSRSTDKTHQGVSS